MQVPGIPHPLIKLIYSWRFVVVAVFLFLFFSDPLMGYKYLQGAEFASPI